MKLSIVYFAVLVSVIYSVNSFSYEGYKVYRVIPTSLYEAKLLSNFENDVNFDFWTDIRSYGTPVDIMVSPVAQQEFENVLKHENVTYIVNIENVEEKIGTGKERKGRDVTSGEVSFTDFMRHDEINAYLDRLAVDYSDIVTVETLGKSFEDRTIKIITISSGGATKPAIYIQATIHAREWIAPPVALYIINQLVENPENAALYEEVDWIIVPVVNPDGYEYCHEGTRLWRKTRTPGTICYGVDGNRNFDYHWMVTGADPWQCGETYAGHQPFSEVETQIIRDYVLQHRNHIRLFIDVHSYGNWILYPWGYTTDPPEDADELQEVGDRVNAAIEAVRGTTYRVGNSNILLYATSGTGPDWAKGVADIQLAYTLELPAGSVSGFVPTEDEIEPVVEETWEGFKAFHEYIVEKFVDTA